MRGDGSSGDGTSDEPSTLHAGPPQVEGRGDLDFSRAVLEKLYSYPLKRPSVAYLLWLLTGLFGGHRLYLDRTGTGLLMLFTVGGAGLWTLIDVFLIGKMVRKFNADQVQREFEGRAPRQLAFMPAKGEALPSEPYWAAKRSTRVRLVADSIVMMLAAGSMGAFARQSGVYEPIIAVVALIAIILLGTRWDALAELPILRGFDRWAHRLRLFYYTNDPGGALSLAFRQVLAFFAFFRKRRRAEVRMYLKLGAWFTIIFTGVDLIQAFGIGSSGGFNPGSLALDMFQTFFATYAFAAPIGAILNKHILLQRSDRVIWVLSAVAVVFMAIGVF